MQSRAATRARPVALLMLGSYLSLSSAAQAPDSRASIAQSQAAPDERLWSEIERLSQPSTTSQPASARDAAERQRREALVERIALYLRTYPGGARRDDAIRLELASLYELGVLGGGKFDRFCERVAAYCARPLSRDCEEEAAYWELTCAQLRAADSRTLLTGVDELDAERIASYARYTRRFPRSRHTPRLAALEFSAAEARCDSVTMTSLVQSLSENFPTHLTTEYCRGRLRRVSAIGTRFELSGVATQGQRVNSTDLRGAVWLVVVWTGADEASCARVREVAAFQKENAELKMVGVNLDDSREECERAAARLGADWPQLHDERGRAAPFALEWGVRQPPCVFVVDRAGNLVCVSEADEWRATASRALRAAK